MQLNPQVLKDKIMVETETAAEALSVGRTFFDEHLAPVLPVVDLAPSGAKQRMPRYLVSDLVAFAQSRRTVR